MHLKSLFIQLICKKKKCSVSFSFFFHNLGCWSHNIIAMSEKCLLYCIKCLRHVMYKVAPLSEKAFFLKSADDGFQYTKLSWVFFAFHFLQKISYANKRLLFSIHPSFGYFCLAARAFEIFFGHCNFFAAVLALNCKSNNHACF